MTKYRVALNKEETFFLQGETKAAAFDDRSDAVRIADMCRAGLHPDAHVVEVQQEPEPEPKYRSPMRLQRDQLREELKRAWDAIPPGIASRSDSVSAAVAKLAYAYNDNQHVADNYRAALRALPEEFRGYYALPDSVAKLAKAYEASQAEVSNLKIQLAHVAQQIPPEVAQHSEGRPSDVAILAASWKRLEDMIPMLARELGITRSSASQVDVVEDRIRELKTKPEPVVDKEIAQALKELAEFNHPKAPPPNELALSHWHDTLKAVGAEVVVLRESLEQCREALPEELRGGSVVLGISALIRSRTYAREQASQYARRYAEARDERDALNSRLSKKQAAIAKALEL